MIATTGLVIVAGGVGRWLSTRIHEPSVLGELLVGMLIGNLGYWLGVPVAVLIMHLGEVSRIVAEVWQSGALLAAAAERMFPPGPGTAELEAVLIGPAGPALAITGVTLWLFSDLGVLFLLFMAGLKSSIGEIRRVGLRSLEVALVGVLTPFALGYAALAWVRPDLPQAVGLFIAAALCATSLGITAAVFEELGREHTPEALIILGAAIIDDVLGLTILAVVVAIITTGAIDALEILRILALATLFFGLLVLLGERAAGWSIRAFRALDAHSYRLVFPVVSMLLLAWAANWIGLAAIVGAFAAGLVLSEHHVSRFHPGGASIAETIRPLEGLFAPVFFVLMGMQVNLAALLEPQIALLALVLSAAAIAGKLVAGLPAWGAASRLSVGIGMMPRGEVGLIIASIGKGLGVLDAALFSAIVITVMATTLLTPAGLKWALTRH